jgi:quercetin dioxygenase-like cupin family protein
MKSCVFSTVGAGLLLVASAGGCRPNSAQDARVLTEQGMTKVDWTAAEAEQDIAVRHLRRTETASHHVVRLSGDERPHIHAKSDLTVTVLSGQVRMNLGSQVVKVGPGQVIDIPRGTPHFAENISLDPSEAYMIFSPPFQKADNQPVPASKSSAHRGTRLSPHATSSDPSASRN